MLPDKLQHQQFVEVRIEQGSRDRVKFPVVVVRPLREVNDHRGMYSGSRRKRLEARVGIELEALSRREGVSQEATGSLLPKSRAGARDLKWRRGKKRAGGAGRNRTDA